MVRNLHFLPLFQIFKTEMLLFGFGGFRFVPYSTVSSLVNNLDDQLYNTFPKQPDPKPSSKGTKPKAPPKTTDVSAPKPSSSSGATPKTTLSDVPPDDNPIEEPNIWAEILKLEGR